jgi:hypothetical protein
MYFESSQNGLCAPRFPTMKEDMTFIVIYMLLGMKQAFQKVYKEYVHCMTYVALWIFPSWDWVAMCLYFNLVHYQSEPWAFKNCHKVSMLYIMEMQTGHFFMTRVPELLKSTSHSTKPTHMHLDEAKNVLATTSLHYLASSEKTSIFLESCMWPLLFWNISKGKSVLTQ